MNTYKTSYQPAYQKPPFTPATTTATNPGGTTATTTGPSGSSSGAGGSSGGGNRPPNNSGGASAPNTGSSGGYTPQVATLLVNQPPPQTPQQQQGQVGGSSQMRVPAPPPPHHPHTGQQSAASSSAANQPSGANPGAQSTSGGQQAQTNPGQQTSSSAQSAPYNQAPIYNNPADYYYSGPRQSGPHAHMPPQSQSHHMGAHPAHPGSMIAGPPHMGNPSGPHLSGAPAQAAHHPQQHQQSQYYVPVYLQGYPSNPTLVGQPPHHQAQVVSQQIPYDLHYAQSNLYYQQQQWLAAQQQQASQAQSQNPSINSQLQISTQGPPNISNPRAPNEHAHQQSTQSQLMIQASAAASNYPGGPPPHGYSIQAPFNIYPSQQHLAQGSQTAHYTTNMFVQPGILPTNAPNVMLPPQPQPPQQAQSQQAPLPPTQQPSQQQPAQQPPTTQQQSQQPVMSSTVSSQPPMKRERKPLLIVDPNTKEIKNLPSTLPGSTTPQPPSTTAPTPTPDSSKSTPPATAQKPAETVPTTTTTSTPAAAAPVSSSPNPTAPPPAPPGTKKEPPQDIQTVVLRNMQQNKTATTTTTTPSATVSEPPVSTDSAPSTATATATPTPAPRPTTNDTNNNTTTNNNNTSKAPSAQTTPAATAPAGTISYAAKLQASKQAAQPAATSAAQKPSTPKQPPAKQPVTVSVAAQQPPTTDTKTATVSVAAPPTIPVQSTPEPVETKPTPPLEADKKPTVVEPASVATPPQPQQLPPPPIQVTPAPEAPKKAVDEPVAETKTDKPEPVSTLPFWNPLNKAAKKRYDREFLMSLKEKPLSKQLPEELKNSDIMLDLSALQQSHYNKSSSASMSGMGDRGQYESQNMYSKGGSMKKTSMKHGGGSMNKYSGRGSFDASGRGGSGPMVINIERELELNRVDNPYQVRRTLDENEALLRDVRNILNKLTPQNLQKLTADLINLPINTQERLEGAIDIIFEKSIDEQVFSTTYAQLCKVLSSIKVPSNNEPGKLINFRTMLLTKCQKEFDSDYSQNINYEKLLAEAETQTDETKKREMREIAQDKLTRAKRRSLGNIRFIGELFKLGMLTEGIMNDCIDRLLKQESDEENLECLCKLLSTIGKELEAKNNQAKMKTYFDKLLRISNKKDAVSARIRFMIMDVIDLRKNQWVPRRRENNPRRIEEIRKEAEEEQMRQEAEYAKNAADAKRMQNMSGTKGSQGKGYQQQHGGQIGKSTSMDSEGFNMRNKAPNGSMVKSIKEVKSITNKNLNGDLTLGPGGGGFSWATKSAKPATATTDSASSSTSTSATGATGLGSGTLPGSASFSASRGGDDSQERRMSSSSSSSSASHQRSRPSQHYEKEGTQQTVTARLSMDQNRYASGSGGHRQVQNVKRIDSASSLANSASQASSQASSRDSSQTRPGSANPQAASASADERRVYTDDEIERKAINMIEEYMSNKNATEALKDFDEFRPVDAEQTICFMEKLFSTVLERTENLRAALGTLLQHAILANKLDMVAFTEGLKRVLEQAEDMSIDVPKIGAYLAQSIAPIFNEKISVEFLKEACEPILESKICGELISEILHQASNRLGHNTVAAIFNQSNLKLAYFLKAYDSNDGHAEFIKANNLGFCVGGTRERTQSASISSDSFERRLNEMLANKSDTNEIIFDKIESEFGQVDCESKAFIRALVISVCSSSMAENKIDIQLFQSRIAILNKYIGKREEFELEALFAIQALDHRYQHQPNFIRVLFELLYDADIVRENVFWKWKDDGREDGHGISVLSLKAFFDWLNEAEADGEQ